MILVLILFVDSADLSVVAAGEDLGDRDCVGTDCSFSSSLKLCHLLIDLLGDHRCAVFGASSG